MPSQSKVRTAVLDKFTYLILTSVENERANLLSHGLIVNFATKNYFIWTRCRHDGKRLWRLHQGTCL